MKPTLNTIPASITGIKQGEAVVVVDNEDRENEGDFVTATCNATFGAIKILCRFMDDGRGLIGVSLMAPFWHLK